MITVDVQRVQRKDGISPFKKFGINEASTGNEKSENLKLQEMYPIPIDLNSRYAMAYSGPIFIG
jgi:hypothetical protein